MNPFCFGFRPHPSKLGCISIGWKLSGINFTFPGSKIEQTMLERAAPPHPREVSVCRPSTSFTRGIGARLHG